MLPCQQDLVQCKNWYKLYQDEPNGKGLGRKRAASTSVDGVVARGITVGTLGVDLPWIC